MSTPIQDILDDDDYLDDSAAVAPRKKKSSSFSFNMFKDYIFIFLCTLIAITVSLASVRTLAPVQFFSLGEGPVRATIATLLFAIMRYAYGWLDC